MISSMKLRGVLGSLIAWVLFWRFARLSALLEVGGEQILVGPPLHLAGGVVDRAIDQAGEDLVVGVAVGVEEDGPAQVVPAADQQGRGAGDQAGVPGVALVAADG